jgi:hypothetical protein
MFAPRTAKTLTALFVAMTIGTLVLMWMDVDPIRVSGTPLTALAASQETPLGVITRTRNPIRDNKWRLIVIHSSVEGPAAVAGCHFVIDAGGAGNSLNVRSNDCWQDQAETGHVAVGGYDWNKGSIGICLSGDFSRTPPSPEQMQTLKKLVTDLQRRFSIPASRVYSYRDISGKSNSPGAAFSDRELADALLP